MVEEVFSLRLYLMLGEKGYWWFMNMHGPNRPQHRIFLWEKLSYLSGLYSHSGVKVYYVCRSCMGQDDKITASMRGFNEFIEE